MLLGSPHRAHAIELGVALPVAMPSRHRRSRAGVTDGLVREGDSGA
jgi:hypothetical protein